MERRDWYKPDETYSCAYCGKEIAHEGFDPCEVTVTAARDAGSDPGDWWFWAHATCVPKAFTADLRDAVANEYEVPSRSQGAVANDAS